jgi:hypothetical protein
VQTAEQSTLLAPGQKGPWTAARASTADEVGQFAPGQANRTLLVTLGALVAAVVIAVPVLLATGVLSSVLPGGGGGGNGDAAAIEQTITGFCQAVHDANYNAAYAYFSPHLKQTVTSYSGVPNALGSETMNGCSEFGSGSFLKITGSSAQDSISYTVATQDFGTQVSPGTMSFVKSGADWLIDGVSG